MLYNHEGKVDYIVITHVSIITLSYSNPNIVQLGIAYYRHPVAE